MEVGDGTRALAPQFFEAFPLDSVMGDLVVRRGRADISAAVGEVLREGAFSGLVEAGLWLYADELERSHTVSQGIEESAGCWWHAIMHRREGDFWNAKYWYRQASGHPLFGSLGFSLMELVDQAEAGMPEAVGRQRREWSMLMEWSVTNSGGL